MMSDEFYGPDSFGGEDTPQSPSVETIRKELAAHQAQLDAQVTSRKATYTYKFPKADHTVDAVVFGLDAKDYIMRILLIERGRRGEPFFGCWALPGGFINLEETLEVALRRELMEETGVSPGYVEQLYTFGDPSRDPRGRVISTAFLALVQPSNTTIKAGDDARKAAWHPVNFLPPLAFDHDQIIWMGLQRMQSKARWQLLGAELLGEEFTLPDLQHVYEAILGKPVDQSKFRQRVLSFGVLLPTGKTRPTGKRPARLYRFDRERQKNLLKLGIEWQV